MTKRSWNIDSLALIFSFIIFAQLLSYVVPQGQFDREPSNYDPTREMVVAGTYEIVSADAEITMPPWHFLIAITKGLADAQDIIFLIFIVGGVIAILRKSGAIDAALHRAVATLIAMIASRIAPMRPEMIVCQIAWIARATGLIVSSIVRVARLIVAWIGAAIIAIRVATSFKRRKKENKPVTLRVAGFFVGARQSSRQLSKLCPE